MEQLTIVEQPWFCQRKYTPWCQMFQAWEAPHHEFVRGCAQAVGESPAELLAAHQLLEFDEKATSYPSARSAEPALGEATTIGIQHRCEIISKAYA